MGKFHREYKMAEDPFVDMKIKHKLLFVFCAVITLAALISIAAYFIHNKEEDTCLEPFSVPHGEWFCQELKYTEEENGSLSFNFPELNNTDAESPFTCILECHPGFTHSKISFTSCTGGKWTTPPAQMTCTEAVALITGGYDNQKSVEIYPSDDPNESNIRLPNLPDWREDHTVDRVDGVTLLCGGSLAFNYTVRTCLQLNLDDRKFYPHSTLTKDRKFHSSIVSGQQLILIGGGDTISSSSSSISTEFLFPRISKKWMPGYPLIEITEFSCTIKISQNSYIAIGGKYKHEYSDHVIQYNIEDGSSTRLTNLQNGKNDHGCVLVKNETFRGILVAGGHSKVADLPLASTEMLNLDTLSWEEMGRLHVGRYGLEMVVLGDRILAMGGRDKSHGPISSVEQFDMNTGKWTKTKDLQEKRANFAVTTFPGCYFDQNRCE